MTAFSGDALDTRSTNSTVGSFDSSVTICHLVVVLFYPQINVCVNYDAKLRVQLELNLEFLS